jgi:predicted adenylyl cyclase CyaB
MPANVEIKARVASPESLLARAAELADGPGEIIKQRDTFFVVPQGRLKLREFGDGTGELIRYSRPDATGPKVSDYAIFRTGDPQGLCTVLEGALGMLGVVSKTRTLFLKGRTRIHIDEVAQLGWFMELEVVLKEGESAAAGEKEAWALMEDLGIARSDLVEGAYLDLL